MADNKLKSFVNLATGNLDKKDVFNPPATPQTASLAAASTGVDVPEEFNAQDLGQPQDIQIPEPVIEPEVSIAGVQSTIDSINEDIKTASDTTQVDKLEKERTGLEDKLVEALGQSAGEGQALAEAEAEAGLPESIKSLQDINLQLTQRSADFEKQFSSEEGRGRTKAFVSGKQAQIRRQQAAEIGALSSVAQALQGNIGLAQQTAQRAVDLEFEPLEREIENIKTFLELNDVRFTRAEKKQATALAASISAREKALEEQKDEKNSIYELAISAAQNGADQKKINSILKARDITEAIELSGTALSEVTNSLDEQLSVTEAQKLGVPLGSTFRDVLGVIPPKDASQSGFDFKTQTAIENIAKSFDSQQITKDFVDVQNKKITVDAIVNGEFGGPGDLALVFEFMKALDPTSVVRESEFKAASKSGSIFKGAFARFNGAFKEGQILPQEVREGFNKLVDVKFQAKRRQLDNLKNQFGKRIDRRTGQDDGQDFLTEYQFDLVTTEDKIKSFINENNEIYQSQIKPVAEAENLDAEETLQLIDRLRQTSFNQVGGDTQTAIEPVVIGGKTVKVDNSIKDKLAQADQAFFNATGKHLQINQSFRTSAQQQAIINRPSKTGGRVAPPGSSFHEKGLAIDVTNWKEAEPFLRQFGFLNNLADDKGHFSVGEFT